MKEIRGKLELFLRRGKELVVERSLKTMSKIGLSRLLMNVSASCELDPSLYSLAELADDFSTYKDFYAQFISCISPVPF